MRNNPSVISKKISRYFPDFYSRTVSWNASDGLKAILSSGFGKQDCLMTLRNYLTGLLNAKQVLPVDSGSTAIVLALEVLKQHHPDRSEVILPSYICPSVVRSVLRCRLIPKFIGIRSDLMINPDELENALNSNTLAVLIPHIYGYPAPVDRCIGIVKNHSDNISIIDDAASGFGNKINGDFLGTKGDIGILSFGQAKMLAGAGGGAVLVNNAKLTDDCIASYQTLPAPDVLQSLHNLWHYWWEFGQSRYSKMINYYWNRLFSLANTTKKAIPQKMNCIQASLIMILKDRFLNHKKRRSEIIAYYVNELKEFEIIDFPQHQASEFGVSRFVFRVKGLRLTRDNGSVIKDNPLVQYLLENGIRAGYGYKPYSEMIKEKSQVRNRHDMTDELIWLPVDHLKQAQDYRIAVDHIRSFLRTECQRSQSY